MENANMTIRVLEILIANYEHDVERVPEVYNTPTFAATINAYKFALKLLKNGATSVVS